MDTRHPCVLFFNQSWQNCLFLTRIFESFQLRNKRCCCAYMVQGEMAKQKQKNKFCELDSTASYLGFLYLRPIEVSRMVFS